MSLARVDQILEENKNQYLETLFKLLRQKSISSENIGMRDCAHLLCSMMEDIGINTSIIETKGHPVVYGEIISDPSAFTLLIYGHYDVQPADPEDEWITPPFEPIIRNNRIYARGSSDNKGQLMAQILAVKTYMAAFGTLPINIKFVFEGEEENGSINLASFVKENMELLSADLVFTSDGPSHQSGAPLVLLGVRGMLYLEFHAKGADFDNHSGNKGNVVPNPVWKLFELLRTMRDEHGKVLIKGFYENIKQPTAFEEDLLKKIPFNCKEVGELIGYPSLDLDGETYYRRLTMEPTFNICGIQSGHTGEGAKTIIPSTAVLKMDIRLVIDQTPTEILEKVKEHVKKFAPDIDVKYIGSFSPSRTSGELKVVQSVVRALEKANNKEVIIQPCMGGSLPDYVWTKVLNAPSVIVPYANFDQANHSPNENMAVDYFLRGIKNTCYVIHQFMDNNK